MSISEDLKKIGQDFEELSRDSKKVIRGISRKVMAKGKHFYEKNVKKITSVRTKMREESFTTREKILALCLSGIMAIGLSIAIIENVLSDNTNETYSLLDISDGKENEFCLYDENGEKVEVVFDNMSEVMALSNDSVVENDGNVGVILIDTNGKMQFGYTDSSYLDKRSMQKIKLPNDSIEDIYVVSARSGAWMRESTEIGNNTGSAVLLSEGQYVLAESSTIISANNSYSWRKCWYYDGTEFKSGYIADEYLINTDFSMARGKHFIVRSSSLNLREDASKDANIIMNLKNGTEVILRPYIQTTSDEKYDWFPVAVKVGEEVLLGEVAATKYNSDGTVVHYLEEIVQEEPVQEEPVQEEPVQEEPVQEEPVQEEPVQEEPVQEEIVQEEPVQEEIPKKETSVLKQVDTSKDKGVDLKLRESPTIHSSIIARIQNGTIINTTEEEFEKALTSNPTDGHNWIKISLVTGEEGYVAIEYLKEYEQLENKPKLVEATFGDKSYSGYLGVDINTMSVTPGNLRNLLTTPAEYRDVQFKDGKYVQTPDFVIIKMGSTGYGDPFSFATTKQQTKEEYFDMVLALANECEKAGKNYGFYYFSQATTPEEAQKEIEYIRDFYSRMPSLKYNTLPFVLDCEYSAKYRNYKFAQKNGKEAYTRLVNDEMNEIRETISKYGASGTILYTDNNTLNYMINYNQLDEENQKDLWMVEVNKDHSTNQEKINKNLIKKGANPLNIGIRQTKGTTNVNGVSVDFNFADKAFFEKYVKPGLDENSQNLPLQNNIEDNSR